MIYFVYKRNDQIPCTYKVNWIVHPNLGIFSGPAKRIYTQLNWPTQFWDEFIQFDDLTHMIKDFSYKNKWTEYHCISIEESHIIMSTKHE